MALPTSMRLRGQRCFHRLHRNARRHHGQWMVLRTLNGDLSLLRPELRHRPAKCCRCAVVISSKVHKRAVRRNRLRRLFHAHLRTRLEQRVELAGRWLLISLRPGASDVEESQLLEECDSLLKSAGLE
ncbi:ribonuclease P protein component [Synechococcus sp. CC9616]|uniref:ribonuclease P protein component n=1 Tax=Synechococcus sp. CC9616 TaxID=110663 RepID=UPI000491C99D|nr:ribonuclease P protein component [Synechococcus sp. CC9616]